MMNEIAWQAHSVETDASPSFAWSYLTDVRNWDDPPAQFVLDGPFADGTQGTTLMPGQEQRIVLSGINAAAYAEAIEASFGANLQGGMKKIAATITTAEARASLNALPGS
jgi:hypothetical protein